ncbi:EAL domain-containing protein [Herbaspirillum sp. ST 5-3]|uniref:EAL domain-containing protein n=1 Tax=Oxalobacteraceae TaxID=75682 RepID=UPI001455EACD|nr:EAL domain-containing protein [Herbaspirillum sp. ST 5-3]
MATILIVDDHALNRQFLMVLLGYGGHRLFEATNGAQALEIASAKRPDLIIADILMPNMDGYEFIKRLRANSDTANTPVIFHTAAYHEREAATMALACGVHWVLPKPSDPQVILKAVQEALGLPSIDETSPARPSPLTETPRMAGLDHELSRYLADLKSSSDLMSALANEKSADRADIESLQHMVQRLSKALSSLQTVSLRLTALIELGIELAAERDPTHLLEISCRVVQDICLAKYVVIGILSSDDEHLEHFITRGLDEPALNLMETPRSRDGLLGAVLIDRSAKRLSGLDGDPQRVGLPPTHPPVHSLLAVPVASQDNVFGWLYLVDKLGADGFSEADERAAATVAAQLATVYENLALYSEIQKKHSQLTVEVSDRKQAQDALRRMLSARTVMAECNHVMVHANDEANLLNEMCRTIVEAGGYHAACIMYGDTQGRMKPMAWAGSPPAGEIESPCKEVANRMPAPTTVTLFDPLRPWALAYADQDTLKTNGWYEHALAVSLPLRYNGQVFGVLTIYEEEPNSFDAEQIITFEALADDIAYGVMSLRTRAAHEKAERDLRAAEEKLSGILDSIDNVVWSATETGFIYLNSMAERIYGRPLRQFYENRNLWFEAVHPEDKAAVQAAHERLRESASCRQEYRIVRPDGEIRWVEERARAIRNDKDELLRFDGVTIDISERKEYEARIEYLADHDALTGLANRNLLGDRIGQAMAHARRNGLLLAVLFLDLDRFKSINDSFGHELGDTLLLEVSKRLRQVVRDGDTVARQGGDEFIILLPDLPRPQDVTAVAFKIFDAFAMPFLVEGHELFVTVSIGATLYPDDGDDMQSLLRNADNAMYRAKEEHGNALQFYSHEMSARALERAELESALRRALDRDEFELFYQPKVDAHSGRIIGAEALIRWHHPEMGLVSPTLFIPMAEEIGLIIPIGEWVLHTACAQNKAWQNAGLPTISVSVNLSARQFRQEDLVESVSNALENMGLEARHLELELTESIVMNSAELFITKMKELKDLGVQLSIDDFGTGYSSLSYLKRFPLHHLKIDQSFVRDIVTDTDDAIITSTVISLGHSLNLKVIAEGVETEEQVAFLRDHHCDEMQGYYFSKPLPAREFASLLGRVLH